MRTLRLFLIFAVFFFVSRPCLAAPMRITSERGDVLAIVGATAYPTPSGPAIENSAVLVVNGIIEKIGERKKVKVPAGAKVIDATGLTLVAGFWNCHVHFTGPQWQDAAHQPAEKLTSAMQTMLTRYGFTTVFDLGSVLANTSALRNRVKAGDILGPQIFTTGEPIFPKDGVPIYVKTVISEELYESLHRTAEVGSPEQARELVDGRVQGGADAIKVFAGSWLGGDKTVDTPLELLEAVTSEAHRQGKLVFAHPQTRGGVENSLSGGVDILAHTAPSSYPWDAAMLAKMKLARVALIPTLTLWHVEARRANASPENTEKFIQAGVEELHAFLGTGGRVLFGTDVGYIDEYDTTEEFELMQKAGMDFRDILTSLTTAPVARFGGETAQGRIAPGYAADLVLLKGDPATDIKALANVKYTIRAGKVIYQNQ